MTAENRSGAITITWGDGNHAFALKWGQLIELQEKCDAGPAFILSRVADGTWRIEDLCETIRLGLIGGGGVAPAHASALVDRYVRARPLMESLPVAQAILMTALVGAPEDKPEKQPAGAKTGAPRSRAGKSASRKSSEPAPPSA